MLSYQVPPESFPTSLWFSHPDFVFQSQKNLLGSVGVVIKIAQKSDILL